MKISVQYEETEVAQALSKIIKDPNAQEFVKLISPMICSTSLATNHFFKLLIGNKLPEVLSNGTLCKVSIEKLGYGVNKEGIREKYADEDDKIVVTVTEFKGWHDYSTYRIEYINLYPDGTTIKDTTYINHNDLEVIEEF
jgi:hypothetical protein